ncbi:hypothetical protein Salat_2081900 [Sesamum alatum]|uniref:Uncharacterized protein n=1 Tax=Sesamum alatum TaxID=300844 RepID=A0AAE1Y0B8_9LAMI|nr:hypothetical protein Salat_2081900 [Sesamum alatum]
MITWGFRRSYPAGSVKICLEGFAGVFSMRSLRTLGGAPCRTLGGPEGFLNTREPLPPYEGVLFEYGPSAPDVLWASFPPLSLFDPAGVLLPSERAMRLQKSPPDRTLWS